MSSRGTCFRLEDDDQCRCGFKMSDTDGTPFLKRAKLFSENASSVVFIEVIRCPQCPKKDLQFIGPDLMAKGIFNKNNFYLYTHRLFDKMTELMSTTEFSFSNFILRMGHDYKEHARGNVVHHPPPSTRAWFAYRALQDLSWKNNVQCPFCANNQYDLVACDGIGIGYRVDRRTTNLKSPTFVDENSVAAPFVDHVKNRWVVFQKLFW
ncbi:hypothetical protein BC829DRAFT_366814 [Chytridium lagenaria]|nr:hypothetical protein BC829DRAFT_367078 [Chytridium lagenaria]KAI8829418.1 hypothetical protein BC829DRAFT_366814 [Chytridium lagenaria]